MDPARTSAQALLACVLGLQVITTKIRQSLAANEKFVQVKVPPDLRGQFLRVYEILNNIAREIASPLAEKQSLRVSDFPPNIVGVDRLLDLVLNEAKSLTTHLQKFPPENLQFCNEDLLLRTGNLSRKICVAHRDLCSLQTKQETMNDLCQKMSNMSL